MGSIALCLYVIYDLFRFQELFLHGDLLLLCWFFWSQEGKPLSFLLSRYMHRLKWNKSCFLVNTLMFWSTYYCKEGCILFFTHFHFWAVAIFILVHIKFSLIITCSSFASFWWALLKMLGSCSCWKVYIGTTSWYVRWWKRWCCWHSSPWGKI